MAITAQVLLDEVSKNLRDEVSFVFDQTTELLPILNRAIAAIFWLNPLCSVVNEAFTCAAGSLQTLGTDAVNLVDVLFDLGTGTTPLGSVTKVPSDHLDAARPSWPTDVVGVAGMPSLVTHYTYDQRDPKRFFVWPGVLVNRKLQVVYTQPPADLAALASNFPLPVAWAAPAREYVIAEALLTRRKELDEKQVKLAEEHMSHFSMMVKGSVAGMSAMEPNDAVNRP